MAVAAQRLAQAALRRWLVSIAAVDSLGMRQARPLAAGRLRDDFARSLRPDPRQVLSTCRPQSTVKLDQRLAFGYHLRGASESAGPGRPGQPAWLARLKGDPPARRPAG